MQRAVLFSLASVLLAFIAESSAQVILPPLIPNLMPPQRPKDGFYRVRRQADEPTLNQDRGSEGELTLPSPSDDFIDDVRDFRDPSIRISRSAKLVKTVAGASANI